MAAFDLHERCARCRDQKLGEDPCVKDKPCSLCDNFSDTQSSAGNRLQFSWSIIRPFFRAMIDP